MKVPFPFIDRVLDIAGLLQRQVRTALVVQKTVGIPQLQFLALVAVHVLCNDRNEWVQTVQKTVWKCRKCSSCGCGRRCGHAATSPGGPGRCFRPVHRRSRRLRLWVFQACHAFFAPFRGKRVPIFQPSSIHSCECSRAPWGA